MVGMSYFLHWENEPGAGVLPSSIKVLVVLLEVNNAVLVSLRLFSFKTSSVVPFVVPIRVEIMEVQSR